VQGDPEPRREFAFGELSLTSAAVAERIDQGEKFVKQRILSRRLWSGFVQWLQRQPANGPFGIRPDGREIFTGRDDCTEWRGSMSGGRSASGLPPQRGERVFHAMEQELFDSPQLWCVRRGGDQSRAFQALERCMHLGGAKPEIGCHLSHWRALSAIANQLHQDQHILR
jgi:hypothetical protein